MDELAYGLRVNVHLGIVESINDGGQAQTATVTSHDGFPRADLEIMQPFGLASLPPGDGAIAMMLSVGGDAGHFVLLPLCCPSVRFGNLLAGESVLYGADGSRVHIRQGGTIEAKAATSILAQVGTNSVTISQTDIVLAVGGVSITVSAAGVAIVGTLTTQNIVTDGNITATGNITAHV
jgi:phage gp45-like